MVINDRPVSTSIIGIDIIDLCTCMLVDINYIYLVFHCTHEYTITYPGDSVVGKPTINGHFDFFDFGFSRVSKFLRKYCLYWLVLPSHGRHGYDHSFCVSGVRHIDQILFMVCCAQLHPYNGVVLIQKPK